MYHEIDIKLEQWGFILKLYIFLEDNMYGSQV